MSPFSSFLSGSSSLIRVAGEPQGAKGLSPEHSLGAQHPSDGAAGAGHHDPIKQRETLFIERHHQIRQVHNDVRHIGNYAEHDEHDPIEKDHRSAQIFDPHTGNDAADEQRRPHGRRDQTDAEIQDHQGAIVHGIVAKPSLNQPARALLLQGTSLPPVWPFPNGHTIDSCAASCPVIQLILLKHYIKPGWI